VSPPPDDRTGSGPPSSPPAGGRPSQPGAWRLGTIAGADVYLTLSSVLLIALLGVLLAPTVEQDHPGLGGWRYLVGMTYAVALYMAVLVHEAAHAAVATRYGFRVESITLHFLGGVTAVDGEARNPRQEFWIAVVGPLASVGVGLAALLAWWVLPEGLLGSAVWWLALSNLLIGVLNLVPGLPLDGGRVLKSLVWRLSGSPHRGTHVAGWGGRVVALLVLLWPVLYPAVRGAPTPFTVWLFAAVLAVFLWSGATASMASARMRARLPQLVARRLARRTVTLPEDLPLAEAVRRAHAEQAGAIVTMTHAGRPTGLVNESALLAVPEERRPWVPVSAVARTLEEGLRLPVDLAGEDLVRAISRRPAEEYLLVEDDGSVYGVLATADVDRAFRETA
jgi:Zn-dependent protease